MTGSSSGLIINDEEPRRRKAAIMSDDTSTTTTTTYTLEEPHMRGEGDRLRTFLDPLGGPSPPAAGGADQATGGRRRRWSPWPPSAPVAPGDLARAGFFFLGEEDQVQCFCCGGVLRCWAAGDDAAAEHRRHFPGCGFVLLGGLGGGGGGLDPGGGGGGAVGNVPLMVGLGVVVEEGSSSSSSSDDSDTDSVDGQLLSQLQRLTVDEQGAPMGQAVYPEMEAMDSRLSTFHSWPPGATIRPDDLARAGFFYTGHGDNVKCFFCDGGLRNWEPGDDPWQEHAKWFPRCDFLLQTRGQEYVNNIQDSHFHLGQTVGGMQTPVGRDIGSGNDVVGSGLGAGSAMLSPVVQSVIRMGFEAAVVESLVRTKYLLTGRHYTNVSDLVTDVLQAEEEDRQQQQRDRTTTTTTTLTQNRESDVRQGPSAGIVRSQMPIREKVVGDPSPEELLRQLQEERTCKVCMDKLVSMVFIPCGHLVVCGDCAASLRHCPICRAVIRGSVRAFMS